MILSKAYKNGVPKFHMICKCM